MDMTRASAQLTEVRTILSRAENALGRKDRWDINRDRTHWYLQDEDGAKMLQDLEQVIAILEKYRRLNKNGTPRK